MEQPVQGSSGASDSEVSAAPEEVAKNCEPGASNESMLVATGSIEEMVEQEMDKQIPGSTTSTISEIQEGIQECQVNSEDEAEELPPTQTAPNVRQNFIFVMNMYSH
jgi:hypothetical protein